MRKSLHTLISQKILEIIMVIVARCLMITSFLFSPLTVSSLGNYSLTLKNQRLNVKLPDVVPEADHPRLKL